MQVLSISESADKWAEAILSNIYYDRDSLNLSECKYCFDVVQQNNAIKEIFNFKMYLCIKMRRRN